MAFDSDQCPTFQVFVVLFQNLYHVFTDALRADVVQTELDNAGHLRTGLKQQLGKIQIMREHDGLIFYGPFHDHLVRRVGWTEFPPMMGVVTVLTEELHSQKREAVVNDDRHAGCSSISRSRVSQAA